MKYLLRFWLPMVILAVTAALPAHAFKQEDVDKLQATNEGNKCDLSKSSLNRLNLFNCQTGRCQPGKR